MSLPAYVLKGTRRAARGLFQTVQCLGLMQKSVATGLTASTTHTIAGGTPLTAEINVVSTVANATDAVTLASLAVGQSQEVFNAGANALAVYPSASGVAIDGGSAGASVPLAAGKRARFTCVAANTVISAQLGVVSA